MFSPLYFLPGAPFFLSLASSFPLFFEMVSFILDPSLVFLVFFPIPTPSLSRLFTYEGLFSLRVALSSEIHKSKSDHCPLPHLLPNLFFESKLHHGWGFGVLRNLLESELEGRKKMCEE